MRNGGLLRESTLQTRIVLRMAITPQQMVTYQPTRLHKRVANR